jgi:DNA ligase-1
MEFKELASFYEKLEGLSSRLSMIEVMSDLFKRLRYDEVDKVVYMVQGVLAAPYEGVEFGLAVKMAQEAISIATGVSKTDVDTMYKKLGDLGSTAEKLRSVSKLKRMTSSTYTVEMVYNSMLKIAKTSGSGSKGLKIRILAEMLAASTPLECRYLIRYPLGQLRLGAGDYTVLEAFSLAATGSRSSKELLESAYNICSDLGYVAKVLFKDGVEGVGRIKVSLFRPIRPALAERLPTAEQILKKMGGRCAVEQKYDGFRCQVHKKGKQVRIYSRNLEETTSMFPDIVAEAARSIKSDSAIFEGEALAFNEKTEEFMPFQETIQRKRKHGINAMAESMPLHLMAFDLIYDGKSYMERPYSERRKLLEEIVSKDSDRIKLSKMVIIESAERLERFFEDSVGDGLEGIVAKDLSAQYIAGARGFGWIKMKRSYKGELSDTVDLVVLGYYLGKGSRAEFMFGGLLCGVYDKKRDMFETISRIGTGFTEEWMRELREKLSKIRLKSKPARVESLIEPDFWVEPKYVVTVRADEITRSPMHTCGAYKKGTGYALRFPRIIGEEPIRRDKGAEDSTTSVEVIEMFEQQKKVSTKPHP